MKYHVLIDGTLHHAEIARELDAQGRVAARIDDREILCDAVSIAPGLYSILIGGRSLEISIDAIPLGLLVHAGHREFQFEIRDPRAWRRGRGGSVELEGRQSITAPMSGKVVRTLVVQGQNVEAGQGILVVEAMKMQNEIRAPKAGLVEQLLVKEGQTVNSGELLAVIA